MKKDEIPHNLPIISLFSGTIGLDSGLDSASFSVAVAIESNKYAVGTNQQNLPQLPVVHRCIEEVTTKEALSSVAGLEPSDSVVASGESSCQIFSTVGKRGPLDDPRVNLFM